MNTTSIDTNNPNYIHFTLSNDRTPKGGIYTLKTHEQIVIGDYISTGRQDIHLPLDIFFKVERIEPWGVHDKVFRSMDGKYTLVPTHYVNEFRVIGDFHDISPFDYSSR